MIYYLLIPILYVLLPRRSSSLLAICRSLLVYGPGVVKHSVGGYTELVVYGSKLFIKDMVHSVFTLTVNKRVKPKDLVPIGFSYVLGRWYLLLEIRYQQKGRSIWDGYNWASFRWCIVLGEPTAVRNTTRSLLIFPRVVLGGGVVFLSGMLLASHN